MSAPAEVEELFDDANGDLALGELEAAVEKYRRCTELAPEFFDGWHALGMALMKLGRYPEAIEVGKENRRAPAERPARLVQPLALLRPREHDPRGRGRRREGARS